ATAFCRELLAPSSNSPATPSRAPPRAKDKTRVRSRHAPTDNAIFRELRCPKPAPPAAFGCGSDNHAVLSGRINVRLAVAPDRRFLAAKNGQKWPGRGRLWDFGMESGGGGHGLWLGAAHGASWRAARRLAGQMVKELGRRWRLAALDPAQDVLVGLRARLLALGVMRRGHIGDKALVAVQ